MLYGIDPGPQDSKAEGLANFQRDYVTDMLMLWRDGIIVRTPSYPQGKNNFVHDFAIMVVDRYIFQDTVSV